jgi:hypothetical protein
MKSVFNERQIQLRDVGPVAAGRTCQVVCPVGPRYKAIFFSVGDTAAANGNAPAVATIGEMRLNYLGGIQRKVTATSQDAILTRFGVRFASRSAISGGANGTGRRHYAMWFSEPWRKRSPDDDVTALQTGFFGKSDQLILELDIIAGVTPALEAWALVDDFNGGAPHKIVKWDTFNVGAVGAVVNFSKLDKKDDYLQLSVFDTSDAKTIDTLRLEQGSIPVIDNMTKQQNETVLLGAADVDEAAGVFDLVFDKDDDLRGGIPAQGLTLIATLSAAAAGTMDIVAQRLGLPE